MFKMTTRRLIDSYIIYCLKLELFGADKKIEMCAVAYNWLKLHVNVIGEML